MKGKVVENETGERHLEGVLSEPHQRGESKAPAWGAGSSMVKEGLADLLTLTPRWSSTPESRFA